MRSGLTAVLWLVPTLVQAQTSDPRHLFGPTDPGLKGPAMTYSSGFDRSAASADVEWKAANDEMRRLGGHMGHAKADEATDAAPQTDQSHSAPGADTAPAQGSAHHGKH